MKQNMKNRYNRERGQSLIEYALILVLVGVAFGFALAATGPAISNVFSNVVYNLLGQSPDDTRQVAQPEDWWLTVTWVAENPLSEERLPTRTLAPASATATDGPSPEPTDITPTLTAAPTETPLPPPTQSDFEFVAPWEDRAENEIWYRLGSQSFMGYADWYGTYYDLDVDPSNTDPYENYSGDETIDFSLISPFASNISNLELYGLDAQQVIDFPNADYDYWTSGNGGPDAEAVDDFLVIFTREVFIDGEDPADPDEERLIQFYVNSDDGVRLWLVPEGESANSCFTGSGGDGTFPGSASNGANRFYGEGSAYPDGCLLIDDWQNQGPNSTGSVVRSVPEGSYTLQIDYYENGGGAELQFEATSLRNPEDSVISGDPRSGINPVAGSPDCNWGTRETDDANTLRMMWDEYFDGDFAQSNICYLELRGYVTVPDEPTEDPITGEVKPAMTEPKLVFWDVWDFADQQVGWLEVAEYIPEDGTSNVLNRSALQWYQIPLRQGSNMNYNWTRNEYDLTALDVVDSSGTPATLNLLGKDVTFRFAMANGNSGSTRRWYIDDVQFFDEQVVRGAYRADIGLDTEYMLSDPNDAGYFIYNPQWGLTANNVAPDPNSGTIGCCAWEVRPGEDYTKLSTSPGSPNADVDSPERTRMHFVQLVPMIDIDLASIDMDGDTGDPMLTFWHGYDISRSVGLEVQYRAEGTDEWRVIPGSGADPAGRLVSIENNNTNLVSNNNTLQPVDIPLQYIEDGSGNPIRRYQIRFAMLVHNDAETREGWWIDNIKLHREDRELFVDYPFYDDAEAGVDQWLATGTWWRTNESAYEGDHAFTDSPNGDYLLDSGRSEDGNHLRFIYALDLNNDTPANLLLDDRTPAGGNSGGAAVNPYLTFWHWRAMGGGDNFHVEWRRASEEEDEWKSLWSYLNAMDIEPNVSDGSTRDQISWEFIRVDLQPIMDQIVSPGEPGYDVDHLDPSDPGYDELSPVYRDDDIYLRFRLYSNNNDNDDGVYIDNIRLEEYSEDSHRLWATGTNGTVGTEDFGTGDNSVFVSDVDEPDWFTKWRLAGGWQRTALTQRNGLYSFHESGEGQTVAPYWRGDVDTTTPSNTYQALELTRIIDMRATDIDEQPVLYFWSRYQTGNQDRLEVHISYELTPDDYTGTLEDHMRSRCGGGRPQCYQQDWGWSQWYVADQRSFDVDANDETFAWQRYQVDLTSVGTTTLLADLSNDEPGRRIRIRFVFDALRDVDANKGDGWYIDNITIESLRDDVLAELDSAIFFDDASNLGDWITEGTWGLSPAVSRSSTGGVASLGLWQESWWDFDGCNDHGLGLSGNYLECSDEFLDGNGLGVAPVSRTVLDISYDMFRGSPRPSGAFTEENTFVGKWVLETPPVSAANGIQPGTYTFLSTSDDGVRLKWEEIDASGNVIGPASGDEWNIIDNWTYHGRTTDMGTVALEENKRYRITLHYFEGGSDAVIILSVGGTNFSFTDSPKQSPDPSVPDVPALPYSNSSLILDGVLDLAGANNPIWQYYTVYELECGSEMRAEVSNDGGFTWESRGFNNNMGADTDFNGNRVRGNRPPDDRDGWRLLRHNLSRYEGQEIMLRFRLDRQGESELSGDRTCDSNNSNYNENGWFMSVWIADITVARS
jgi:Flp pilus assembly pilin Flp